MTLGKLNFLLLLLFCLSLLLLSVNVCTKNIRNELAPLVMGTVQVKKTHDTHVISFRPYARVALAWTGKNINLEKINLKQTELQKLKNRGKKGWG